MKLSKKTFLLPFATTGIFVLGVLSDVAYVQAAGFYIKEQSVTGLGRAFAGQSAMGEDASTIFFNPAGMTRLQGAEVTAGAYLLIPQANLEDRGSTSTARTPVGALTSPVAGNDSDNPTDPTPLSNIYLAYPLFGRDLWIGLGISTPFGLTTKYDSAWFGRYDSIETDLLTLNIAPSVAYRVNKWISIGGGIDVQYADAKLSKAIFRGVAGDAIYKVEGDDWTIGYNFGVLFEPITSTRIGLHYRSQVEHTLKGNANLTPAGSTVGSAPGTVDLNLPNMLTAAFAHDVTPQLTLMAEYNWYGWSNFKELQINSSGGLSSNIPQNYEDTYSVALGAQFQVNESWTVRSGIQYDQTPTVDNFRSTGVPDGDRYWLSAGASYNVSENFTVDVAYAHVFIDEVDINTTSQPNAAGSTNTRATSKGSVDIIAAALRYKF